MTETRTVEFTYTDPSGTPLAGYITFEPTVTLVNTGGDTFVGFGPVSVTLDATGHGSVVLACTDDPTLTPSGWVWAVSEFVPGGRNRDNTYFVTLPTSSATLVGLTDLPGATPTPFGVGGVGGGGGGTVDLTKAAADTYYDALGAATSAVSVHKNATDPHGDRAAATAALGGHTGAADPHPQYLTQAEGDGRYATVATSGITKTQADTYYDAIGAGTAAVAVHDAAADPHAQYLNNARGDARYSPSGALTKVAADGYYDAIGAAVSAVNTHNAQTDPHGDRAAAGSALAGHTSAGDPHGDRAYAAGQDSAHVASADPHTQYLNNARGDARYAALAALGGYLTKAAADGYYDASGAASSAASAAVSGHVAAADPHGDRAFATSAISTHSAAADPHGDRAFATSAISTHSAAADPHGDRAYAAAQDSAHVAAADPHTQYLNNARGDARYAPVTSGLPAGSLIVFKASSASAASALARTAGVTEYLWINSAGAITYENGVPATPAASGSFYVSGSTRTSLSLAWDIPFDGGSALTGQSILVYNPSGGVASSATPSSSATTATISSGLTSGISYTCQQSATNGLGAGTIVTAPLPANLAASNTPLAPTGLTVTPGGNSLAISWTAPSDTGGSAIVGYTVQWATLDGKTKGTTNVTSGTTKTFTSSDGIVGGTTYYVSVQAYNANGLGAIVGTTAIAAIPAVPGLPTGLSGTAGSRQVALTWTAPASTGYSALTDYRVEWSSDGGTTWLSALVGSATAAYTVTGLTYGVSYVFRVSAVNAVGTGFPCTTYSSTPTASTPSAPNSVAAARGNAQVTVSWNVVGVDDGGAVVSSYAVQKSVDGGTTWTSAGTSTTPSLLVTALTNGQAYVFRVASVNAIGTGTYSSASASVTPSTVPTTMTYVYGLSTSTYYAASPNAGYTSFASAVPTGITTAKGYAFSPSGVGAAQSTSSGMLKSTDGGATWATANGGVTVTSNSQTGCARVIQYVNGWWLMGSSGKKIAWSSDADTWAAAAPGGTGIPKGFAYGVGSGAGGQARWVAVGFGTSPNPVFAYTNNTDPTTGWTFNLPVTGLFCYGVAFASGTFVAIGGDATTGPYAATSTDGINWTSQTISTGATVALLDIAYGAGLFVAVGNSGKISTSPDGATWTSRTSGTADNILSIMRINSRFVAITNTGNALVSTDGITWSLVTPSPTITTGYGVAGY